MNQEHIIAMIIIISIIGIHSYHVLLMNFSVHMLECNNSSLMHLVEQSSLFYMITISIIIG